LLDVDPPQATATANAADSAKVIFMDFIEASDQANLVAGDRNSQVGATVSHDRRPLTLFFSFA
jgi:hypothetical protein